MARSSARGSVAAVITAAQHPRSLDVETRQRRYLWSMLVRTVLFLAMCVVPGLWWKFACMLGAMFIPPVAVLLANNSDNHKAPVVADHEDSALPALTSGTIIPGSIADDPDSGRD